MLEEKQNILIIGQGANISAIAKKFLNHKNIGEIYITPESSIKLENIKYIDIREDDTTGLLKFALENNIHLTIPVSEKALKSDIVSFFQANGQNIFGPTKDAATIALNNAFGKKFLYKIHAQTSKFGIFDKQQLAEDYLKSAKYPVTIKCSEYSNIIDDRLTCPTISLASEYLSVLFSKNESDILIEEFTFGKTFTVYYITDGYTAIPITSVADYKFTEDGDGGILSNGIGCYAPDFRISDIILSRLDNIIKNTLSSLEKKETPYLGILGVECVLTGEDRFFVSEFKPFFQHHDCAAVLNLIDDDLIKIFMSCINGFFSDEYEQIKTNDFASVAATVTARQYNKHINGLDKIEDLSNVDFIKTKKTNNDSYLTEKGALFTLTRTAGTLSRARNYLYEDLSEIHCEGIKYRKDICANKNP
ncbi:hypothetical protein HDR58_01050 [bacterium]|nr:hypothetical protein [bacterium]